MEVSLRRAPRECARPDGLRRQQRALEAEAELRRSRLQLSRSLGELERALERTVMPGGWLRARPWTFLIAACALGVLLGRRQRAVAPLRGAPRGKENRAWNG